MLKIAPYCQMASRQAGTSDAQYKAALKLVQEAMTDTRRVAVQQIAVTKDAQYRVWWRLKLKNAPSVSYRAIIEIMDEQVSLHVVLPRNSQTYHEVKELWKKHRVKINAEGDEV